MAGVVSQMMHRGLCDGDGGWGCDDGRRWGCDGGGWVVRVVGGGATRPLLAWSVDDGEPNPRRDGWGDDGIDRLDGR